MNEADRALAAAHGTLQSAAMAPATPPSTRKAPVRKVDKTSFLQLQLTRGRKEEDKNDHPLAFEVFFGRKKKKK
jgi:hypothetical protein